MQLRSGLASVLSSNHRRVQFTGMTAADSALLAAGQGFEFQGESLLVFTVASVISAVPTTAEIELLVDYNGAVPFDTPTTFLIWKDFTPVHGLYELSPGDADIRTAFTTNMRTVDTLIGQRIAAQGVTAVTTAATNKTITGTFPTPPYAALVTPNWLTTFRVRTDGSKTNGQFVIDFGTAAPASSQVHWAVLG